MNSYLIKRTTTSDPDFDMLIQHLDHELWNELGEDQATYDQHNKVPQIPTAVVVYAYDQAAACGCFKAYAKNTIEIKRMYVQKPFRGKGLSKIVLNELEKWAIEKGYTDAILETSIHFDVAKRFYEKAGYFKIENYPPYKGLVESLCMRKILSGQ